MPKVNKINLIEVNFKDIKHIGPYNSNSERFLCTAEDFSDIFPLKLRKIIRQFSRYSHRDGYLLVRTSGFAFQFD